MAARRSNTGAALDYEAELWSMLVSNIKLGHMLHRTRRDLSAEGHPPHLEHVSRLAGRGRRARRSTVQSSQIV